MGLDIYVRFGRPVDWEPDGIYYEYYQDQMTGFESAPYAGYLRESWGSLEWVAETAERYDGPNPYNFFPDWEGYNGEELRLENGNLEKVLAFRDRVLRPYLHNSENKKRASDLVDEAVFGTTDDEHKRLLEEYNIYRRRIADAIGFLNFVELHKDKPNLTVIFG